MNALFVQRRVRSSHGTIGPVWEQYPPSFRVPIVTEVKITQEIPGGWTEASFTIPPQYNRFDTEDYRVYTQVWLYDGLEPAFYGFISKSIPIRDGGVQVTCKGAYRLLDETRMRIIWGDGGLGDPNTAPGSAQAGSVSTNSFGNLVLSLPKDHGWGVGAYIAVDYYAFNEPTGPRDGKVLDGWDITIGNSSNFDTVNNLEGRIYGMTDPNDANPDLLQIFTAAGQTRQETSDASFGDNTAPWQNHAGYRLFRLGLYAVNATAGPYLEDKSLVVSEFRVTTRGKKLGLQVDRFTSTLIKDLFDDAANGFDTHHLLQEPFIGTTNEMVVGNIPASQYPVANIAFTEWVSPREIIESFAAIDGSKVGMWGPTRRPPKDSHVTPAAGSSWNWWHWQPAELVYEDWRDLSDPDYTVRLQRGASWEPDQQDDTMITATYAGYTSQRGRTLSVYAEDLSQDNYLYEQGWHKADDWQIEPPVKSRTASTLSERYTKSLRQPALSGTLTITEDAIGSIVGRDGERIVKLSTIRPGVMRVVDAKGPSAGRITRIEYSAASSSQPETLVLSINSPAGESLARRLAQLARRADRQRLR